MYTLKIKEIRTKKSITLSELSKLSKVSKGHLSNIERGIKVPSIDILCKIAKALHCQVSDLFECKS